jgi:ATPase subunit of ABC transporter with duplicated ATPase domains
VNSRSYVAGFNFKGADQQKRVKDLSGGERNRVHLARMLKSGANVLLLDEPTNDLDVDTLRALEDALLEFAGCVVVISHDRWFLDRSPPTCCLRRRFPGPLLRGQLPGVRAERKRQLGTDADQPHRIRYKRLVHQ